MKKIYLLFQIMFLCAVATHGQSGSATEIRHGATNPATCSTSQGWLFWNTTTLQMLTCVAANTWGSTGASITSNSPYVFNVRNPTYGAKGDAKFSKNCSITQNASVINDTTDNPWTSADVGKKIFVTYTPSGANGIQGGGVATISALNSVSQVSISPSTIIGGIGTITGPCLWYTQDDSVAFKAAYNAAHASTAALLPGYQTPTFNLQSTVYCPPGNYAMSKTMFNEQESASNTLGVSLVGDDCHIFLTPDFAQDSSGIGLIYSSNVSKQVISGLAIHGMSLTFGVGSGVSNGFSGNASLVLCSNCSFYDYENILAENFGSNCSATSGAAFLNITTPGATGRVANSSFQNAPPGSTLASLVCNGCSSAAKFDNDLFSNAFVTAYITNGGGRTANGGPPLFHNVQLDECGNNTVGCTQLVGAAAIFEGGYIFGDTGQPALSVDATSEADMSFENVGAFSSGGNVCAATMAAGARIYTTNTTWRGNGTSAAFCGPGSGTANVYDLSGNPIQNWTSTTCNNSTPADPLDCNGKPAITAALLSSGNVTISFPVMLNATSQLGGTQVVNGTAPTCTFTSGGGTSPSCTLDTGSTNAAGIIILTTGTGAPAASGTITLTFAGSIGTNKPSCILTASQNGAGQWNARASFLDNTPAVASDLVNWDNNGVALSTSTAYRVNFGCYGK